MGRSTGLIDEELRAKRRQVIMELDQVLLCEKSGWRQRSRFNLIKEGLGIPSFST